MKSKHSKNDLMHCEVFNFRKIETAFLKRCRQFGYREIKTSTIEHQYIFTAKNVLSPTSIDRMIDFFDKAEGWGGEPVVLRPDSAPCVVRLYNECLREHPGELKQKYCYVENQFMLTDDKEAISERWQCGVESIGLKDPQSDKEAVQADVEVIYMANDIIQEIMEKDISLYLSYPSIINDMISIIAPATGKELKEAIKKNDPDHISILLEKAKEGEKLLNFLAMQGESAEYLITLKDMLQGSEYAEVISKLECFITICRLLDSLECSYVIDFSLLGELDYYTGIRFQISAEGIKNRKNIFCAGGRYDNLIGDMYENIYDEKLDNRLTDNASIPATGFAFYMKNILQYLTCKDTGKEVKIYMEEITKDNITTSQKLCEKLFSLGFLPQIIFCKVESKTENISAVIEVSRNHKEGYGIQYSREKEADFAAMIGKLDE